MSMPVKPHDKAPAQQHAREHGAAARSPALRSWKRADERGRASSVLVMVAGTGAGTTVATGVPRTTMICGIASPKANVRCVTGTPTGTATGTATATGGWLRGMVALLCVVGIASLRQALSRVVGIGSLSRWLAAECSAAQRSVRAHEDAYPGMCWNGAVRARFGR